MLERKGFSFRAWRMLTIIIKFFSPVSRMRIGRRNFSKSSSSAIGCVLSPPPRVSMSCASTTSSMTRRRRMRIRFEKNLIIIRNNPEAKKGKLDQGCGSCAGGEFFF